MISAESRGEEFLVKFKGKKNQFNEYINKIMSLKEKKWNFEKACWAVPKNLLWQLEDMFNHIEFLDEVHDLGRAKVTDYSEMGKSMKLPPYDYQKEGIKFCLDMKEALVIYPCGSGKTPLGIGVYIEAIERGIIKGPGMIIVKASLKTQWIKEIEKFSDLKSTLIMTSSEITMSIKDKIKRRQTKIKKMDKIAQKDEIKEIKNEIETLKSEMDQVFRSQFDGFDLFVMNYETLREEDIRRELHRRKVDFIFADEVHYVKSREAKRSEALYEFGDVKMKIGATATPIGKNPEDLFGIFKFISPTIFPNFKSFANLYVKYAGYGRVTGVKNKEHLIKKYAPNVIVKTKEEVSSQLPSLLVMQRYCNMTPEQLIVNQRLMESLDELKKKDQAIRAICRSEHEAKSHPELLKLGGQILATQTFAQELCDAPEVLANSSSEMAKQYVPKNLTSPKLDLLMELIEEVIDSEEKVCVFSKYKTMQKIITDRIHKSIDKEIKIAYVNGGLSSKARYAEVYDKFRDNDDYKVLLMTDAGAEGLNLSKCKYIIEFDLADSYGIQTQRHGRIERSDSTHDTVFVYQLIANESWDTIAVKIIEKKEGYDSELIKSLSNPDLE